MSGKRPYVSPVCLGNIHSWDENTNRILLDEERERECSGFVPRDYDADPVARHWCASPFREPRIDEQTAKQMIEERERKGLTNMARFVRAGFPPLHQGQTNLCWMNATIDAIHSLMLSVGGKELLTPLSPGGAAAWETNFRNVGGNVSQAVQAIIKTGAPTQADWPANVITSRQHDTKEAREHARRHMVLEYDDLDPGDVEQMWSMCLHGFAVPFGNYSMSHAVLAVDPVVNAKGRIDFLCRNSGYLRDSQGLSIIGGKLAIPHDACVIRAITTYFPGGTDNA